jgi:hypothetical protein
MISLYHLQKLICGALGNTEQTRLNELTYAKVAIKNSFIFLKLKIYLDFPASAGYNKLWGCCEVAVTTTNN